MSIELVNLSFIQNDLTPSEKHILTILCFRADKDTRKCWPSFKSIMHDSGYSRDTVNRVLFSLREKEKIEDVGERKGKTKKIIVYEIVIHKQSHHRTISKSKQSDGAQKQSDGRTVKQSDGKYRKDHNKKDQRKKDFSKSDGPKTLKDILGKLQLTT